MISLNGDLFLLFVVFYLSWMVLECKGKFKFPQPSVCSLRECPPHEVIYSDKDYEIRSYEEANWVSSPTTISNSYQDAANEGFLVLFNYFLGGNHEQIKINMTSPILVDVEKPSADVNGSAYTVFAYLPKEYQNNIPAPDTDQIKIVKLPRHKYCAVRRFGGFIINSNIPTEIAALRKTLQGTPYERVASTQNYTLAGYNSPFVLKDRVNEVFLCFD